MAALQNIGAGHSNDAFYRYKMPKMITKIEGQGNGIRTNVVNMVDIAKALVTNIEDKGNDIKTKVKEMVVYITKYFGYELGTQSKFDEKTRVSVVNGAHDTDKLVRHLEDFIEKYVQCYRCRKPETEILITKTMMIQLKCAACGFISDVDMRDDDKLTKFILKNPPMEHQESVSVVEDHHSLPNGSLSQADDDDDIQWHADTSLEAARQRKQLSVVTAEMAGEPKKEKPKLTKKVVGSPPAACNAETTEPKEKSEVLKAMENGKTIAPSNEKLAEKIKMNLKGSSTVSQVQLFLGSLDGSPQEVMTALLDALFGGIAKRFSEEVTKKKNYLAIATREEGSQILLLRAIERFCRKSSPKVVKEVALVLKTLYDADVLEEEYMVQWYQEGLAGAEKNSQIWKFVKPFIEWLQNAESESESESE